MSVTEALPDEATGAETATNGIGSALASLKEIVSIIMGLALTNSILALITLHHYTSVAPLSALPVWSVLFTLVLVANIIRFYHGNVRHVDSLYGESAREVAACTHGSLGNLGLDFTVVFIQSIIFAVLSFYASRRPDFLLLFIILLMFDLIWNIVTQQEASEARDVSHQRGWMLNNVVGVLALVVFYMAYQEHHHVVWLEVGAAVVAVNTLADYVISWKFYFPWIAQPKKQRA